MNGQLLATGLHSSMHSGAAYLALNYKLVSITQENISSSNPRRLTLSEIFLAGYPANTWKSRSNSRASVDRRRRSLPNLVMNLAVVVASNPTKPKCFLLLRYYCNQRSCQHTMYWQGVGKSVAAVSASVSYFYGNGYTTRTSQPGICRALGKCAFYHPSSSPAVDIGSSESFHLSLSRAALIKSATYLKISGLPSLSLKITWVARWRNGENWLIHAEHFSSVFAWLPVTHRPSVAFVERILKNHSRSTVSLSHTWLNRVWWSVVLCDIRMWGISRVIIYWLLTAIL